MRSRCLVVFSLEVSFVNVDTTTWLVLSGTGHSLNSDCLHPIYSFQDEGIDDELTKLKIN